MRRGFVTAAAAMVFVVALSNYAVQFPVNDWLTWGAFTYPVAFLVTDLSNRALGPTYTRRVIYVGFLLAVALSIWLATPRIAVASGIAFLAAQLWDVAIFDRLRNQDWWRAPLVSSVLSSALDTAIFFSVAFAGTGLPWITWAIGDYAIKLAVAAVVLVPYGALMPWIRPWTGQQLRAGQQQS